MSGHMCVRERERGNNKMAVVVIIGRVHYFECSCSGEEH